MTPRSTRLVVSGVFFTVAALLAAASGPSSAEWTGASGDFQISFDDNEYARAVQAVFDGSSGNLHAFWLEDSPTVREVLYARSTDLGATWSSTAADRQISLPDGKAAYEECGVALGLDGRLVVVWSEDLFDTREVHFGISTDQGVSFTSETSEQVLSDPNTLVDTLVPSVAIDAQGVIHVVWNQSVGGTSEVCYSRSTDGGATWTGTSEDRVISFPDGNGASEPKVVVGEGDRLIVIWREAGDGGGRVLLVGISDDGGDTWSSETGDREISQPVNLMTSADVAAVGPGAPSPEIYAVYAGSFDTASPFHYETYVTYSWDNGETWTGESATIPISFDEDHTRSTSNPDVFVSSCGGVTAAWDEEAEPFATNEIHISQFDGASWSGASEDIVVSFPDGEDGYRPAIAGVADVVVLPADGGRGELHDTWILWTEFAGGATDNYEVHLSAEALCEAGAVAESSPSWGIELVVRPNPSSGPIRLELRAEDPAHGVEGVALFEVFDAGGRLVFAQPAPARSGAVTMDWDPRRGSRPLDAGVYFARVRVGDAVGRATVILR